MIAGDISIRAICDDTGKTAEIIPDGRALAVGGRGTFDLEGTAGNSPNETRWEASGKLIERLNVVHFSLSFCILESIKAYPCEPLTRGSRVRRGEDRSAVDVL